MPDAANIRRKMVSTIPSHLWLPFKNLIISTFHEIEAFISQQSSLMGRFLIDQYPEAGKTEESSGESPQKQGQESGTVVVSWIRINNQNSGFHPAGKYSA
jgi:hypothetical protein